jgi:hypothetical protein
MFYFVFLCSPSVLPPCKVQVFSSALTSTLLQSMLIAHICKTKFHARLNSRHVTDLCILIFTYLHGTMEDQIF